MEKSKSELITTQQSIVKWQQQLLDAQAKPLMQVTTVVDSAVDREIRSYNQIVSETLEKSFPVFTEDKLKKAVLEAVGDRETSQFWTCWGKVCGFGLQQADRTVNRNWENLTS